MRAILTHGHWPLAAGLIFVTLIGCTLAPPAELLRRERTRAFHAESLDDPKTSKPAIRHALLRYAEIKSPQALKKVRSLARSTDTYHRESAAIALRYYTSNDEELRLLASLARDSEQSVRIAAFHSLIVPGQDSRIESVAIGLLNAEPSQADRISILGILYRSAMRVENRTRAQSELFALLQSRNQEIALQTLQTLVRVARKQPEMEQQLRAILNDSKDRGTLYLPALTYLVGRKDPTLATYLPTALKNQEAEVRRIALQQLFKACPENRWSHLALFVKTENDVKLLEEVKVLLRGMAGVKSAEILEQLKSAAQRKTIDLKFEINSEQWKKRLDLDPCTSQAK